MIRRFAFILVLITLLTGIVTAYAGPQECANCGQNNVFMVFCSNRRSHISAADCTQNANCAAHVENYRNRYECPNCSWYEISDHHRHEIVHSICENEWLCVFSERAVVYYYPATGTYSVQGIAK